MTSRTLLAGAVFTIAAIINPISTHAQLFGGGTCSTALGPCASLPQQLLDYARQAEQLQQEVTTALQEVTNTIRLPAALFQNSAGEVSQILSLAKQADLLLGNTGQFINNLSGASYPIGPLNNPMSEIVKQQNAVALAINQLGSVIAVENPHIASQAAIVAAINDQGMTADGRLKALQASSQLAATTGQQLHGMETVLVGMAQGQHATMLADHDRQAMQDKQLDLMSNYVPDYPTTPGF